jgi:hypothetical protein
MAEAVFPFELISTQADCVSAGKLASLSVPKLSRAEGSPARTKREGVLRAAPPAASSFTAQGLITLTHSVIYNSPRTKTYYKFIALKLHDGRHES